MAETNTTYYQSRHTGEEIDDLLSGTFNSILRIEERSLDNRLTDDAAENANHEAAKIPGMVTGKADLDPATGYIKSSQIAPLQGRQTGVNTTDGYFSSDAPALLFEGDRTHEICFTTGDDVTTDQRLFTTARGSQSNVQLFVSNGSMYAYIGPQLMNAGRVSPETSYHVLLSVDVANTTGKVYVNGVLTNQTSVFPNYQNANVYIVGRLTSAYIFKGIVRFHRIFNYALTASEVATLWNGGEPERYMLPLSGEMRTGLVAEYIAAGLLADKWRDTSGAGLDLPYVPTATGGTAELSYQSVPNQGEIVIDSGIFFTDIAEGTANKRIAVPRGYVALAVAVYNYNASALTNVTVQNWTDERAFIYGATVYNARAVYSVSAAGNKSVYNGTGITIDPTVQYLKVMATGNTTSGGMRVRVICKYLGV